jgi:hypothetical protein
MYILLSVQLIDVLKINWDTCMQYSDMIHITCGERLLDVPRACRCWWIFLWLGSNIYTNVRLVASREHIVGVLNVKRVRPNRIISTVQHDATYARPRSRTYPPSKATGRFSPWLVSLPALNVCVSVYVPVSNELDRVCFSQARQSASCQCPCHGGGAQEVCLQCRDRRTSASLFGWWRDSRERVSFNFCKGTSIYRAYPCNICLEKTTLNI